jgi:hypothetical protein
MSMTRRLPRPWRREACPGQRNKKENTAHELECWIEGSKHTVKTTTKKKRGLVMSEDSARKIPSRRKGWVTER